MNGRLMALNSDNDPWTGCVVANDLSTRDASPLSNPPHTGTHFDAAGLRTLGKRYAIKYLEMTAGRTFSDGSEISSTTTSDSTGATLDNSDLTLDASDVAPDTSVTVPDITAPEIQIKSCGRVIAGGGHDYRFII